MRCGRTRKLTLVNPEHQPATSNRHTSSWSISVEGRSLVSLSVRLLIMLICKGFESFVVYVVELNPLVGGARRMTVDKRSLGSREVLETGTTGELLSVPYAPDSEISPKVKSDRSSGSSEETRPCQFLTTTLLIMDRYSCVLYIFECS